MSTNDFDGQYYEVATPGSLSEKLMAFARDRIYADFLNSARRTLRTPFSTSAFRTSSATSPTSSSAATLRGQNHGCRLRTGERVQGFLSTNPLPPDPRQPGIAVRRCVIRHCHRECRSRARRQRRKPAFLHLRNDPRRRTGIYHRATSIFPCGASHGDSSPSLVRRHVPCRVPRLGQGEMGRFRKLNSYVAAATKTRLP